MLTFPKVLTRSLMIAAGAILGDGLVSIGMTLVGFGFVETIGDLMLVEVAFLFLVAGLIDFSSSVGAAEFRKTLLHSRQEYSQSAHKEAERRALVFVSAGILIFATLIVVAVFTRS